MQKLKLFLKDNFEKSVRLHKRVIDSVSLNHFETRKPLMLFCPVQFVGKLTFVTAIYHQVMINDDRCGFRETQTKDPNSDWTGGFKFQLLLLPQGPISCQGPVS